MPELEVGEISHLALYPVKGCRGVDLKSAILTQMGLETEEGIGDRQFMLVKATPDQNGIFHFITQRDKRGPTDKTQGLSDLVHIKPKIVDGELFLAWNGEDKIPFPDRFDKGERVSVRVWDDIGTAIDQGDVMALWLSDHLNYNVRLVKATDLLERPVKQNYLENDGVLNFQDGYPIHWYTQASLDELSRIAGTRISWRVFRPNMIVKDLPIQFEHQIFEGEISGIPFVDPKPCDRCPVTNIDQKSGKMMDIKPLSILAKYKRWRNIRGELKVIFGENMVPQGWGKISVGDKMVVVSYRDPALVYGAVV